MIYYSIFKQWLKRRLFYILLYLITYHGIKFAFFRIYLLEQNYFLYIFTPSIPESFKFPLHKD